VNLRIWYDIDMQSFSILLGLGALFGLLLLVWRAPKKEAERYLDAGLWILFAALVGGRAMTVVVNFQYYQTHAVEIVQVWTGGISGVGALAGGMIAIIILSLRWKLPAGKLADALLPLAGAIAITAWLGCWMDNCGYGWPSEAWWAIPGRDEWGVLANRVPVQLLGAILTLMLVWLLDWASKRIPIPGLVAAIGLLGLSAVIFALTFVRADPVPILNGLRLEAWAAMGLMIISLSAVVVLLLHWKFKKKENPREEHSNPGR
jgi:phosphatidylglycerol:prolipoprotein diacylglycerol transferase